MNPIGWACVIVFLQILWMIMKFTDESNYFELDRDFPRVVPVYVFGSVAVVLLNSFALMTELILKIVTGDRTVEDLRFVVFPSECLFAVSLIISAFFPSQIAKFLKFCQNAGKCKSCPVRKSQETTTENQEMRRLNSEDQENQPESVETQ